MTQTLHITEDMDAALMAKLRSTFDTLSEANEDVEINIEEVDFIDSSGVGGLVFLYKRLLASGYKLSILQAGGQPLRLLTHLRMTALVASRRVEQAA